MVIRVACGFDWSRDIGHRMGVIGNIIGGLDGTIDAVEAEPATRLQEHPGRRGRSRPAVVPPSAHATLLFSLLRVFGNAVT